MFSVVLNGELEGFFPGKRELRQGDHLSPYLFLLVMEGLTSLLQNKISHSGVFTFHPRCKSLNITDLVFADDLFVLTEANEGSFHIKAEVLKDFHLFSGLQPNLQKTSIFYTGVSEDLKTCLGNILPILEGFHPVKYLGVLLISTMLKAADCNQLKENILHRIQSWANKTLTYGSRHQLIQLVLFSIQVYWSSLFILPQ